ncbi:MAG: hypothetical protein PF488_01450 [Patescibacteria group bacterium]|jgi:hypothetical protein|nr:hypothetical protein [Patescibacteria group bacterium]
MKNILIIVFVFFTLSGFSQARVFNTTNYDATISSDNDLEMVIIKSKKSSYVNFIPSDGIAEFKLGRYEGLDHVVIGQAKRKVKKGRIALEDFSLKSDLDEKKAETGKKEDKKKEKKEVRKFSASNSKTFSATDDFWAKTTVVPKNESSVRILVLAPPFKGLALESEQNSEKKVELNTGKYTFPVYYDPEPDSISTGRKFRWAVVSKIVVENQDTFRITNHDLREVSTGKQIEKMVKNNLPINFLIVAGENRGKVIPANNVYKLDMKVGWNVTPVQYLNEDNLPVQAVLLLMANDLKKPIFADKKSGENMTSIEPDNLILTGQ